MLMANDSFVLLDFGVGEVSGYGDLLIGGSSGTYGFIAPETFLNKTGKAKASYATDIFAAGVTLLSLREPQLLESLAKAEDSREALQAVVSEPLDLSSWPDDMASLLKKMLSFVPSERVNAEVLLREISKHVDFDAKLKQIEKYRKAKFEFDPSKYDMGSDESFSIDVQAPISSWAPIEETIAKIVDEIKPRFFIIELGLGDPENKVYVQAISGGGFWILEAMSEKFSKTSHSLETKANFVSLGWTPPSKSEPNYIVNSTQYLTPEIVRRLVDAFEFGYPVRLEQIDRVYIHGQGKGKY
jgi:serine/threonine protein kinase